MPVTGLFFIPTSSPDISPAQDLISRLNSAFEPTPLSTWAMSHRLFRETPSSNQGSSSLDAAERQRSANQRFLQVLSLSHHSPKTYVSIAAAQPPPQTRVGTPTPLPQNGEVTRPIEPSTVVSIPTGGASDEFSQLIATKFGPLWQLRQVLHVANGATFEVGEFKIRIGELKQAYGGGTQMLRGAICEIEWVDNETTQSDDAAGFQETGWQNGEPIIKGFWNSLNVKGAREVFSVPDLGDEMSTVRQWCEILRLR